MKDFVQKATALVCAYPTEMIFLALGAVVLAVFGFVWYKERYARTQKDHTTFKFLKFALLLVAGALVLFGGFYVENAGGFLGAMQYGLESLYTSLKLFFAGGEVPDWNIDHDWIKGVYILAYYSVCTFAVITTATTVLSFFHDRAEIRRLRQIGNRRDLYVFNELNEKALSVAESVERMKDSRKPAFVFCNAVEDDFSFMERVKELSLSFCLKNDVAEIHALLKSGWRFGAIDKFTHHYFLLNEDQPENVRQAIVIAEAEQNRKPSTVLKMFVFAQGVANGRILDGLHNALSEMNEQCMVRRISPAWLLAKNVVTKYDEEHTERLLVDKKDPDKDLTVLVVGMGQYGLEIARMLTWFYQRKEGGVTIHLTDRATGIYNQLKVSHKDWVDYRYEGNASEDSCFRIIPHENIDVYSLEFEQLLKETIIMPDAVYVALGDDDLNIEAAHHIRSLLDRLHYNDVVRSYEQASGKNVLPNDTIGEKAYVVFPEISASVQNDGDPDSTDGRRKGFGYLFNWIKLKQHRKDHTDNNNADVSANGSSLKNDYIKIFSVVHDDKRCENLQKVDKNGSVYERYHIQFVGRNSEVFCYDNIFNSTDEKEAQGDHINTKKTVYQEYYHLSSLSRVYHKRLMMLLYKEHYEENNNDPMSRAVRMHIADKRWNTYMRTIGYRCVDDAMTTGEREQLFNRNKGSLKRASHRGKWHNSIVPFGQKGKKEQENNLSDEKAEPDLPDVR